jgi:polyferredoxin
MGRRLPVVGQAAPQPDDDPLAVLRGGPFALGFALLLAVIGLVWLGSERAAARDLGDDDVVVKVHSDLRGEVLLAAAPPQPPVEDITPPQPPVEDITPDRFEKKKTKEGSIVLEDPDASKNADPGLDEQTKQTLEDGGFFDPNAFAEAKTVQKKAYVHLMPGIPNTVFYAAAGVILLLSFVIFERYGKAKNPRSWARPYWRFELTRWAFLRRAMKSRWFQPALQIPVVLGFLAMIVIGLVGSQEPGRNIAPVVTWNIWWIGLIFLVLFFGNLWCFMCPWTAIPDWLMRFSLTSTAKIRGLGRKYPRFKIWMWPAIILFAFVTWLEIIFDAANRPWLTSFIGIFMIVLAWVMLVVYERKAMCRYVCFVGRVSGQYAMMGMLELRRRDPETCRQCRTKDCYHGREGEGLPCPTHEFMGGMNDNQYCTLCTECVKSCPHDNIALRARSSGADILYRHRSKPDEAYLAVLIFIVSAFHGAAMVPWWGDREAQVRTALIDAQTAVLGSDVLGFSGSHGGMMTFTILMGLAILLPGLLYWALCWVMRRASGSRQLSTRQLFIKFAYTLLPVALFYHLAHNATHVFYEWSKLRRLISDPLGWGHDFFGTARAPLSALWSPESIWYLQVTLIVIGHIYGIIVAQREAFRLYGDRRQNFRVHLVMVVGMIAMSLLSLWLLAQPMYMRTADV